MNPYNGYFFSKGTGPQFVQIEAEARLFYVKERPLRSSPSFSLRRTSSMIAATSIIDRLCFQPESFVGKITNRTNFHAVFHSLSFSTVFEVKIYTVFDVLTRSRE